jgi:PIN domain nuclease of toxin-antitoxin system
VTQELLLDTHIWFWYLTGSKRLASKLRRRVDRAGDSCWLSPISIWEVSMLAERGRIRLREDATRWVRRALAAFPVREAPVSHDVALRCSALPLPHPDPADRFLAATVLEYGLTLVTIDQRLVEADWLPTLTA